MSSSRADGKTRWAKPSLVLLGLWGIGNTMVIFLAALVDVHVVALDPLLAAGKPVAGDDVKALDLLPQMENEAPFDLVFIDADKPPYPQYLEWALRLTRPGSIIVADNCVRRAMAPHQSQDEGVSGIIEYNKRIASDPRLVSLALAMDDDYTDGFASAVVRQ